MLTKIVHPQPSCLTYSHSYYLFFLANDIPQNSVLIWISVHLCSQKLFTTPVQGRGKSEWEGKLEFTQSDLHSTLESPHRIPSCSSNVLMPVTPVCVNEAESMAQRCSRTGSCGRPHPLKTHCFICHSTNIENTKGN